MLSGGLGVINEAISRLASANPLICLAWLAGFHEKVGQPGGENSRSHQGEGGSDSIVGSSLAKNDQADARNGQGDEGHEGSKQVGFHFINLLLILVFYGYFMESRVILHPTKVICRVYFYAAEWDQKQAIIWPVLIPKMG
jgi:hypothetical protein